MKGFSFLEIAISILIATIVFVTISSLAFQSLIAADQSRDRYIATNLAIEGIEVIANIRVNNWITNGSASWRNGLNDGANYIAQYNSANLVDNSSNPYLHIDSNNNYCYVSIACSGATKQTKFKRQMQISTISNEQIKITSTVTWEYNSNFKKTVTIEERLYNWK